MNEDVREWINGLSSPHEARRLDAAEHLAQLGEGARGAAVPLTHAAGDPAESVREWAVAALEGLGTPDPVDLGELRQAIVAASHEDVAYWAVTLVGRLGAAGSPAVPELVKALQEAEGEAVRQRAAWALGRIGPDAAGGREALEQASGSDNPRMARLAASALEQIGS